MRKGRIYLSLSAICYAIAPLITKYVKKVGSDGATLFFLRSLLALPIVFIVLKILGIPLLLSKKELRKILILGPCFLMPSMTLLYSAYELGNVSTATTLHFIYPFIIIFISSAFFGEKQSFLKWLGCALAGAGLFLSIDVMNITVSSILAVLSGFFYAFYVIYLDKSGIDDMNSLKLTFYLSLFSCLGSLILLSFSNGINLPPGISSWIVIFINSVLVTLVAIPLFQMGVRKEGSKEAGIISMLEPVCSILLGVFLLGETLSFKGWIGSVLLFIGIVLLEL